MSNYSETEIERAASTAHNVNKAYCEGLDDYSQEDWATAPDWQKESAREGVRAIIADPSTTPAKSHQNWLAHKESRGWVYGESKDVKKKTHPCMVPYSDLGEAQRVKDTLFQAVVRGVLGL